jgi:hypothetical protein
LHQGHHPQSSGEAGGNKRAQQRGRTYPVQRSERSGQAETPQKKASLATPFCSRREPLPLDHPLRPVAFGPHRVCVQL